MGFNDLRQLAENHGLRLAGEVQFNEMGIDFRVGFATDQQGRPWVLRIPRRAGLDEQILQEQRILQLVGKHLSVQVPDWQIATSELVAYPLLRDQPALTFDAQTYAVSWHMDQHSPRYVPSLARALVELHAVPRAEVRENNLKIVEPVGLRAEIAARLQLVKSELGLSHALEIRYNKWLDNDALWPDFTRFIHGDLYAGHVLTTPDGTVSGIIDWSTAHLGDIAQDFSGHVTVFGEASLKALIAEYRRLGGHTWDQLFAQTIERAAAAPLAYGFFAVETQDAAHISGAKAQLGVA
ncbi:Mph(E)/Mph(G) family macrolide 2'-phosphotransferase [Hymenobacter sp. B81]|uniref:Mph(E)/Mph(G) family macrolide 2'-phosphotransferase n=1 Tax=Hymenobacter sp. B81 TaxID=3344878 RepID=UPI0037DC8179